MSNEELLSPEERAYLKIVRKRRRIVLSICAAVGTVAAAVGGYLYLSHQRDVAQKRSAALAAVATDSGTLEAAVAELTAITQRDPKDVEALSALARASMRTPKPDREHLITAARAYYGLLEIDPARSEERLALVRLLDLLGQSDTLVKVIPPLLETQMPDVTLLDLATQHHVRLGQKAEALKTAEQWVAADPKSFRAYVTYMAALSANGKDQREPASFLNTKLASLTDNDAGVLARSVWLIESGDRDAGAKVLDTLLARPEWDRRLARHIILVLDQLGRRDAADEIAAKADLALDESLATMLSLRDIDRGGYLAAMDRLQSAPMPADLSRRSAQLCLTAYLADQLQKPDVANQARQSLASIPAEYAGPWVHALAAISPPRLEKNDARKLAGQLRVSALVEEGAGLLQLATAKCLIALDEPRSADRVLAECLRVPAGWSPAARQLIDLRLSRGEIVQAMEAAQFTFDRSGRTIDSAITLAITVSRANPTGAQAQQYVALLREIHRAVPAEPRTLGLYVRALANAGDPTAKQTLADAIARADNVPVDRLLEWAEISQQLQFDLEPACIERAEKLEGATPRVAMASAMLLHRAGKNGEALAGLRAARELHKDQPRAYDEAIASFLSQVKSPDANAAWLKLAGDHPDDVSLQVRVLGANLATESEQIKALIERIRKAEPNNAIAELADIRLSLGDTNDQAALESALLRLNRLVEASPDLVGARLLLVDSLIRSGNDKAALSQWEAAQKYVPDEPPLLLAGARLYIANGQLPRAQELLDKLALLDANLSPEQRFDVARLQIVLGHADRAVAILDALPDRGRDANLVLSEALFRTGDVDRARQVLDPLLADADLNALLFAASVADSLGQREEADELLQRAEALDALQPAEQARVAQALADRGAAGRAIGLLTSGEVSNDTALRIAARWIEKGEVETAFTLLREAAGRSKDPQPLKQRLDGQARIQQLVDLKLPSVAARLLESPEADDTKALVDFARLPSDVSVRDQQLALDSLAERHQASYAVQMFVAERYVALNQPNRAERAARRAAELMPAAPQPLAVAAVAMHRAGNTGRCAQAIADWRRRLPAGSTLPDPIEAHNLANRREYTELLSRFESRIGQGGKLPLDLLLSLAEALCARNREADAASLLQGPLEQDPNASIAWMDRVSKALDPAVAAKALDIARPFVEKRSSAAESVSYAAESVSYAIAADRIARRSRNPSQRDASARLIAAVEARAGTLPPELVVKLAEHHVAYDEYAPAESLCRAALAAHPRSPSLLRALAQLLRARKQFAEALPVVEQAIALADRNPLAHESRAAILLALGRPDDAVASAEAAVRLDPLNPRWHLRLAEIRLAQADLQGPGRDAGKAAFATLDWFFREPEVWPADLIEEYRILRGRVFTPASRPASAPVATP